MENSNSLVPVVDSPVIDQIAKPLSKAVRDAYEAAAGADAKSWLIGATVPLGAFDIKGVYAQSDIDGVGKTKKAGLGAHYNFSKRTKVYVDVAKIGGSATIALDNKTGYDLGLKHTF